MFADCGISHVDTLIDETVKHFLKASRVHGPPVDAITIAHCLGFAMIWDERQTGRARIAMIAPRRGRLPRPTIFLRPDPRPERVQWALAHEIGEAAMESVLDKASLQADQLQEQAREQFANRFAGRLLLPSAWFATSVHDCNHDLLALKQTYPTASHELIGWRMLDLPNPAIISLFDQGRLQSRRSNLLAHTPPLTSNETDAWRQAHQSGELVRRELPVRIDAWPIHEPAWKREIVRMEVVDLGD
jgi:IrrE N-terminal-like domain